MDGWQAKAKCKDQDMNDWFPERGDSVIEAQRVCNSCPVKYDCLDHAVTKPEHYGIWAGGGERPRKFLRRLRRDGPHPDQSVVFGCSCEYCTHVRDHFQRLKVLAQTGRGPSPAWNTNGPNARHRTKACAKRGCDRAECRAMLRPERKAS